jgi:Flp pilus assembly protein TadD
MRSARLLRAAPVTVPCVPVVALLAWWAADQGGFPVSSWAPGAIAVLALLAVALLTVPNAWAAVPRPVVAAAGLLAGYTAWSYASLLWAGDRGAAWQGANRTLLYLAIFCLFALWRQRGPSAALLVGGWALAVVAVAVVLALLLATTDEPARFFAGSRLSSPAGYPNAAAATFLMALWPAVALAATARVPWAVRGLLAGGSVLFWDLALLALSRGAVLAVPLTLIVFVVVVPGRLRHLAVLVPVALAAAATTPLVLRVGDRIDDRGDVVGALHAAAAGALVAAVVVAVLVGALAALERARPPRAQTAARAARVGRAVAAAGLVAVVAGGLAVAGNPVHRADRAWHSFKGGYDANGQGNRLSSGLGSNRYDFYRVAVRVFEDHPVAGIGADNFFQQYLRRGASYETPRYPHSLELRALTETGIVGALLLFGALAAASLAAWRAMRGGASPLRAAAAGGAFTAFAYWVVHGSADWFFEYPGLGAAAFAMLGLACGLCPRRADAGGHGAAAEAEPGAGSGPLPRRRTADAAAAATVVRRPAAIGAVVVVAIALALPFAGAWGADHEVAEAAQVFATRPMEAYDRLDRAASLDPFSSRPASLEGSIALRFGDLARADRAFAQVLERVPDDQYATLERGAIASARGDDARARLLLARAAALAPRDALAREALTITRRGGAIDVQELNRRILAGTRAIRG